MFKASLLIASLAFAATASAADQVATKGSLVVDASQNLAEATICLDGHSTCHALRKLEVEVEELERALKQEGSISTHLIPANKATGTPEIVCFGLCCSRCYDYTRRRLQDVFDEHRLLELTGESELKDIECFSQPWGLQCN